jgi:hypothetical protein
MVGYQSILVHMGPAEVTRAVLQSMTLPVLMAH